MRGLRSLSQLQPATQVRATLDEFGGVRVDRGRVVVVSRDKLRPSGADLWLSGGRARARAASRRDVVRGV